MLPISISFQIDDQIIDTISMVIDICFLLDIIIVFRTSLLDEQTGEEIKDSKIIADAYLKGRFTIDLLSTLPFDLIAMVSARL